MTPTLFSLLKPSRLTEIVDIGASLIDAPPPYKEMLALGLCRITGFEPQEQEFLKLRQMQGSNERYLPYAVGDGEKHTLHICQTSGMTSLLKPDPKTLQTFGILQPLSRIVSEVEIQTYKLDAITEIKEMDFLKIDIQGGELSVFKNGCEKLSKAVAIQTEVSFIPLYEKEPCFGVIDTELRGQGFIPHCFNAIKNWPIAPCVIDNDPLKGINQLLEADIVYVRNFLTPESMDDEQLKHLALIAHYCYHSYDLTLRSILLLEERGALQPGAQQVYLDLLKYANKSS